MTKPRMHIFGISAVFIMLSAATAAWAAGSIVPIRMPGLWQVTGSIKGIRGDQTFTVPFDENDGIMAKCVDASSELKAITAERNRPDCTTKFGHLGYAFTISSSCDSKPPGFKLVSYEKVVVDSYGRARSSIEMTAFHTYTNVESTIFNGNIERRWLRVGACPAGVKAGDIGLIHEGEFWPAAGFEDTEISVFIEPEAYHGASEVYG